MLLWGDTETFKSWLVMDLAWAVAEGRPWLGWETTQSTVLLINTELPESLYQERWRQMALTRHSLPPNLHIVTDLRVKLDTDLGLSKLSTWAEQTDPSVIIVDNLYRTFRGNLSEGPTVNLFLDTMSLIRERHNTAFVFVHHSRKSQYDPIKKELVNTGREDAYGSKFLIMNASTVFEVRRVKVKGVDNAILLICEKASFERTTPSMKYLEADKNAQFHPLLP